MKRSGHRHKAWALLLALASFSIGVSYCAAGRFRDLRLGAIKPDSNAKGAEDVIGAGAQPPSRPETEASPSLRVQRREERLNIAEVLKAEGVPEEDLKRFAQAQAAASDWTSKRKQNLKAEAVQKPPLWSDATLKALNPGRTMYDRMRKLAHALVSKDPKRIQKAREMIERDYRPRTYSMAELRLALSEEEATRYEELRSLATKWNKILKKSDDVGVPLQDQPLTLEHQTLDQARTEYNRLAHKVRRTLAERTLGELEISTRRGTHRDPALKAVLNLRKLADFAKGRRLHAEVVKRRKLAKTFRVLPEKLPPEKISKDTWEEALLGNQLYTKMLKEFQRQQEAAGQDEVAAVEGRSDGLNHGDQLFLLEEERMVKQWLTVDEIEEYVYGKEAGHELPTAKARNKAARKEGGDLPVSAKELEDLQIKFDRYKELQRTMDERRTRLLRSGQAHSASPVDQEATKKGKSTEVNPVVDNDPVPPQEQQNAEHQQVKQPLSAEDGQRRAALEPDQIRLHNPLRFVKNPASLVPQAQAGLQQAGNRLQQVPGAIRSIPGRTETEFVPWLGSVTRNAAKYRVPVVKTAPLPV
ncbi:MAG: hypothetical protein M1823_003782 [Watsoniomyces obsoletus]|nr:MAG: hypothetical protein M1823_003782 [Watsoniomyces obsoletus]